MEIKKDKPRGLIRDTTQTGTHLRFLPSPELQSYIEHYWYDSWQQSEEQPSIQRVLPHPNIHLTVEVRDNHVTAAQINGVLTGVFEKELQGQAQVFGIKFLAGGFFPFIRKPLHTMTDKKFPLTEIFGDEAQGYITGIQTAGEPSAMAGFADLTLTTISRKFSQDIEGQEILKIIPRINSDASLTTVDSVCELFSINKRKLQRLCKKYVGVGPKWIIKRYRLHEALATLEKQPTIDWPDLALELGYSDQAHFIRDFKAYIGITPTQYEKKISKT